jgi:hypothetical protein
VPRPVGVVHEDRSAVLLGREACGSDGTVEDTTSCALGCHAQEARCNDLDPSNGLAPHLDLAVDATDIVLTDGAVIDTTSGSVTNGNGSGLSVSSAFDDAGRPVGIFVIRAKSFRAGDVTVRGDRALAIVSDGDVIIEGVLSVSAALKENGPGALPGAGCTGGQGTGGDAQWSGGGGGGFGTAGGSGAMLTVTRAAPAATSPERQHSSRCAADVLGALVARVCTAAQRQRHAAQAVAVGRSSS